MKSNSISIISNRRRISLSPEDILYVHLVERQSVIHISGGKTYETYTTIDDLEQMLGSGFLRADRATLVSAKGIHTIGKKIELINGELLSFPCRRKRELKEQLRAGRRQIVQELAESDAPTTREEYQRHYASYDSAPFAFTDIEMVFNEERAAVDWIFRYGNEALAELEGIPLKEMIGSTFSSLFDNMDAKWLRCYERAALYGETMELEEYSPEIDANLRILCFPTFPGHCGCILHDMDRLRFMKNENWFGMAAAAQKSRDF
mgnify:CR=1 FL=1